MALSGADVDGSDPMPLELLTRVLLHRVVSTFSMHKHLRRLVWFSLLGGLLLPPIGCATVGYYGQSLNGHLSLMAKREPIDALVKADDTSQSLKTKLVQVQEVREFASEQLGLPDNASYTSYVKLDRPYVVWNVVATPEFSLEPRQWCFLVVGCVSYRGYYNKQSAIAYAQTLRARGGDVMVAGATAYSTLGWFADPVLSTMLEQPDHYVVAVIIHELAHQKVYIKHDSAFNEAFAMTVEQEGVQRWYLYNDASPALQRYEASLDREQAFIELVLRARERLDELYSKDLDEASMRAQKEKLFAALRDDYARDRARIGDDYQGWFAQDLNNASLALVATYHERVEAFQSLLRSKDGDLSAFYEEVERLGELPAAQREAELARRQENGNTWSEDTVLRNPPCTHQ